MEEDTTEEITKELNPYKHPVIDTLIQGSMIGTRAEVEAAVRATVETEKPVPLGEIGCSPGVVVALTANKLSKHRLLDKHRLTAVLVPVTDEIASEHVLDDGTRLVIVTNVNRSKTTITLV